jgi:hypothetical protein
MSWRVSRPALHKVYPLFFASFTVYECDARTEDAWLLNLKMSVERPERFF